MLIELFQIYAYYKNKKNIIFGPWKGELGYELLYWIPFISKIIKFGKFNKIYIICNESRQIFYKKIFYKKKFIDLNFIEQIESQSHKKVIIKTKIYDIYDLPRNIKHIDPAIMYNILRVKRKLFISDRLVSKFFDYLFLNFNEKKFNTRNNNIAWLYKNDYLIVDQNKKIDIENLTNEKSLIVIYSNEVHDGHYDLLPNILSNYSIIKYEKSKFEIGFSDIINKINDSSKYISTWGGASYIGAYLGIDTVLVYSKDVKKYSHHKYHENKLFKYINLSYKKIIL